jgi:hypothetical protein
MAPVPAWLHGVVELAHAVPAKLGSGNGVMVRVAWKLPPVPPVQILEKARSASPT